MKSIIAFIGWVCGAVGVPMFMYSIFYPEYRSHILLYIALSAIGLTLIMLVDDEVSKEGLLKFFKKKAKK